MDNNVFSEKPKKDEPWDVAIIGSGPAGLTAAIYTARGAASTVILGGEKWGGQLMQTTDVDNFPGFEKGIQGPELMMKMRLQVERFGVEFVEKNVESVEINKDPKELTAAGEKYLAKTVIVATGAETKWLGVPGEDKLRGRGVSSCASCDAPFFKDKKVAVVGGGDAAMEEALVLTKYASSVAIFHRRDSFRASKAMQKKVLDNKKVNVFWNSTIEEFIGEQKLEKVKVKDVKTNEVKEHEFDGVFVAIGHTPSSSIFKGAVDLDEKGYVKRKAIDSFQMSTSVPGVFVAGDIHDFHYRQAVTAAGLGCMAAMEVLKYLESAN